MASLSLRWKPESRAWIDELHTLPRRLFHRSEPIVRKHLAAVMAVGRSEMPMFEGLMADDLHLLGVEVGDTHARGVVSWSEATVQPEYESQDPGTAPFHYPWGKHDGIEPHKVYLFSAHTGTGRAKLIRWAKAHGVVPGDVPEDGSAEDIRDALGDQPPWLNVAPQSTPFLLDALESVSDALMADVSDLLGEVWRE